MSGSALIFDLDGTLVDSVYRHVEIWHEALHDFGVDVPAVEIHRRIGMAGTHMLDALSDARGFALDPDLRSHIEERHDDRYARVVAEVRALPGAPELLAQLQTRGVRWAIATSARESEAAILVKTLSLPPGAHVVTQARGAPSKPSPEPFETAAAKLGIPLDRCMVVGDSVWDILASRRAGAFGIGLLSGGYGREELVAAGAYRIYEDAAELAKRLPELGTFEGGAERKAAR